MTSQKQIAAFLSDKAYDGFDKVNEPSFGLPGGDPNQFSVIEVQNHTQSGYYGAVIKDNFTGKLSIVSRGTELNSINDLQADLDILIGGPGGGQFEYIDDFIKSYNADAEANNQPLITKAYGHSLGGTLSKAIGI